MLWLVFIQCEFVPHLVCKCGALHPLEDCFIYDETDFPDEMSTPTLFADEVLVFGDCECVDDRLLRPWPVPERWSCGEFRIQNRVSE